MNQDLSKSFYNIQNKHSSLFLDVNGQGIHNGDNVAQWQHTGLDNQKWLFVNVPGEPDTYYIIAKHSGLFLDVTGQKIHNGDNVAQWKYTGDLDKKKDGLDNQKWILESESNGYVKIKAKHSNLFLDVTGQKIHNGDNVAQWQNTRLDNQVWKLIPAESINIPEVPAREPSKSFEPKMLSSQLPESVQEGVTGVEWISCVLVKDTGMPSLAERLKKSPWYRLERTTTWVTDASLWHNNTGRGTDKRTWTYASAWQQTTQEEFSTTTSFETTAGVENVASVKSSVSFTASFMKSLSRTEENATSTEIEIPAGTAKALFRRQETLTLKRMDGKKVPGAEWITYGGTATASFPDDE